MVTQSEICSLHQFITVLRCNIHITAIKDTTDVITNDLSQHEVIKWFLKLFWESICGKKHTDPGQL